MTFTHVAIGIGAATLLAVTTFAQGNSSGLPAQPPRAGVGAVYVLDNAASGSHVVMFRRAADGRLARAGAFSTGGRGTGDLLDAQGTLILSQGKEWLFAANAGSDDISIFAVGESDGLALVDRVPSGGDRPVSLTVSEDLVYVLNSGSTANITAFDIGPTGRLTPIAHASALLSTTATERCTRPGDLALDPNAQCNVAGPSQVQFAPGSHILTVTERLASRILTYTVNDAGRATLADTFQDSPGSTPFGFDFAERGRLIVSNAFLDLPGQGSASSFLVASSGAIDPVTSSGSAANGQTASCWLTISNDGRVAFVANPLVDGITSYRISDDGSLSLLDATAGSVAEAGDPRDMALSENGRFLYALNNRTATVSAFEVSGDGTLIRLELDAAGGFPANAVGLAAH